MTNFIEELLSYRHVNTLVPFYPDLVKGYTEIELSLLAKKANLTITGQLKDFLLQMGRCSGGLLYDGFTVICPYDKHDNKYYNVKTILDNQNLDDFDYWQTESKEMFAKANVDLNQRQYLLLTTHCEDDYAYSLLTADKDNFIWLENGWDFIKTTDTLLQHLQKLVKQLTEQYTVDNQNTLGRKFFNQDEEKSKFIESISGNVFKHCENFFDETERQLIDFT